MKKRIEYDIQSFFNYRIITDISTLRAFSISTESSIPLKAVSIGRGRGGGPGHVDGVEKVAVDCLSQQPESEIPRRQTPDTGRPRQRQL